MKLNTEIINEIIKLGGAQNGRTTDPSLSNLLKEKGVASVTAHIEKLALLELVTDATPIFGKNGGMWIGYTLSEKGLHCAHNPAFLAEILASLEEKPINEVSNAVRDLLKTAAPAPINQNFKADFIKTLKEIAICFDNDCYVAAISLCGKILEICLVDILLKNNIDPKNIKMLGNMIKAVRHRVPKQYISPNLENVAEIIAVVRNSAVHYNTSEEIPIPSRDQTIMIIFAMRDVVSRNLYGK